MENSDNTKFKRLRGLQQGCLLIMKACYFLIAIQVLALSAAGQAESYADEDIIQYAKTMAVARLDRQLPWVYLDKWLRSGPPQLHDVRWEVSRGCDVPAPYNLPEKRNSRLCVKFVFKRTQPGDPVDGSGTIRVGTVGVAISGRPQLELIEVGAPVGGYGISTKLSDLPRMLNQASALPQAEKQILNYARTLDAKKLDPTLPAMGLEEWLTSGPAHLEGLVWQLAPDCGVNFTGEKTSEMREHPFCVGLSFIRSGDAKGHVRVEGQAMIRVGILKKSISGEPHLERFTIFDNGFFARNPGWKLDFDTTKISDLPRAVDEFSSR